MNNIKLEYQDYFDENKNKSLEFSSDLIKEPYNLKSLMALKVDGKSMQPVINDKALVVADLSQKELLNASIYLVYKDNRMWIKKYDLENETFVSINKDFAHLVYDLKDVHLVAKVLLTFTTFA